MLQERITAEVKEKLLAEKARLEAELGRIGKKNPDGSGTFQAAWEEYGSHEEENATEVAAYTDSLALSQALDSELHGITSALERIEQGTYGVCANCSKDIAENRLLARPMSILCIECQEKAEIK